MKPLKQTGTFLLLSCLLTAALTPLKAEPNETKVFNTPLKEINQKLGQHKFCMIYDSMLRRQKHEKQYEALLKIKNKTKSQQEHFEWHQKRRADAKAPSNIEWEKQITELEKTNPTQQAMIKFCPQLFYRRHPIGPREKFLSPALYKNYQQHLSKLECQKAEKILYTQYRKTYPDAPKASLSTGGLLDGLSPWYIFIYNNNPEMEACREAVDARLKEEEYKKAKIKFEKAQQVITEKNIQTQPIKNIARTKILDIKETTDIEYLRNFALHDLVNLATKDHIGSLLFLATLSKEGEVFKLKTEPFFVILARLKALDKLPTELTADYDKAKASLSENLSKDLEYKVRREASYKSIHNYYLSVDCPTVLETK